MTAANQDHHLRPAGVALVARARETRRQAATRLSVVIDDFLVGEDARLDERTRLMLARALAGVVGTIESDIRRRAARSLEERRATAAAEALLTTQTDVVARLTRAGLLRDVALMGELLARVREATIGDALPSAVADGDRPSLLVRLTEAPEAAVATAARALTVALARRRDAGGTSQVGTDLSADLHHRLVWWVAAAIREALAEAHGEQAEADRMIAEAALRDIAGHDEGETMEAAAARLAMAIDARTDELAPLLVEALGDRRLPLFVAILAHAIGLDHAAVRDVVLEPEGDQLWLALRAAGLTRQVIARVGLALADADPRRDVEALTDTLDEVSAIPIEVARAGLAPLALPGDFRAAIDELRQAIGR